MSEIPETGQLIALKADTPLNLSIVSGATASGTVLLIAIIIFLHLHCQKYPTAQDIAIINRLTGAAMIAALVAIMASEIIWKSQLRRIDAHNADAIIRTAFTIRTGLREMSAILGAFVTLMASTGGVLKLYPVYWATLLPAWLFLGYLAMHWPTFENLDSEIGTALQK